MLVALVVAGVILSAGLALRAFQENLLYFFTPSQVAAGEAPDNRAYHLGGMVLPDSIQRDPGSLIVNFIVTDYVHTMPVTYSGVLPDLFAEDQGVVAKGRPDANGLFVADEILAKHDEDYMPPEIAEALARAERLEEEQLDAERLETERHGMEGLPAERVLGERTGPEQAGTP